jgi:hypothetical protein
MKRLVWLLPLGLLLPTALGQDKKPAAKEGPRVVVVSPLGAAPGTTTKLTIRGLRLDTVTDVYFPELRLAAKVIKKNKVGVADKQEPARVGDSELVCELTLPAELTAEPLAFVVVSPDGTSPLHRLLIDTETKLVAKKEPNNGFRQAQPIKLGEIVEGVIHQPLEVDVYRLEVQAGQQLTVEVQAARHGSALDAVLTLYDANGLELASSDDVVGADPRLTVQLPAAGAYFIVVMDAHDNGGGAYGYRVVVK